MSTAALRAHLALDVEGSFEIVSCSLSEGASDRTHAVVEIAAPADIDFADSTGGPAVLSISGPAERTWTLTLGEATYLTFAGETHRFRLDLFDPAWALGLSKDTRKFRNLSVRDIVSRVLGEGGVAHRFALVSEPRPRNYTVQYRESHLAFVERLLAAEGIHSTFEPDGTMVLSDASFTAPFVSDRPFELIEARAALAHGEMGIHHLEKGARVRTGQVTLGDHNWKRPDLPLRETASAGRDTELSRFQYMAGFRLPDEGARLAQLRLEAHRTGATFVLGRGNVPGFAPGAAFAVSAEDGDLVGGDYFLASVHHQYRDTALSPTLDLGLARRTWFEERVGARASRRRRRALADTGAEGKGAVYENEFLAIPRAQPFRPISTSPEPRIHGVHTAMVRGPRGEEVHTDAHGRFRAQFRWDGEATGTDQDSRWIRMVQETATSMTLARTGWEVFVGYAGADPERPIGLGRAINDVSTPTYALPQNKTKMTIRTPTVGGGGGGHNEIALEDRAGEQRFSVRAERDLAVLVKNERAEKIGKDDTHSVGADLQRTVAWDQTIRIGADSSRKVGADETVEIQGNRTKTIAGSEKVTAGAGVTAQVGKDNHEKVANTRLTVAGTLEAPDWKSLGRNALRELATGFLKTLAPGVEKAYEAGKSIYGKWESLPKTIDSLPAAINAAAAAAVKEGLGRQLGVEEATDAKPPATPAGNKPPADKPPSDKAPSDKPPAGAKPPAAPKPEPPKTPLDFALAKWDSTLHTTLDRMMPTQKELEALVPDKTWHATDKTWDAAIDKLGKDAWGIVKKQLSLESVINLFSKGGIARTSKGPMTKVVGGAYLTIAVLGIDWRAGYLYVESAGGLKVTVANKEISQKVTGKLDVTVGGAIQRSSTTAMEISSGLSSKLAVGGLASYSATQGTSLFSDVVEIEVDSGLGVKGGNASLDLDASTVRLKGKLSLSAGKTVTLTGSQRLEVKG